MSTLSFAITRFRTTLCVIVFIFLAGLMARAKMPVEASPQVSVPVVYVGLFVQGISAEDGTRLLVRPAEKELRNVAGIKEVVATAQENSATVLVEFESEWDIDQALTDVREAIDRAKAEMPDDAEEPIVSEIATDPFPAISVTIASETVGERALFHLGEELRKKIETVPEVLEAKLVGTREEIAEILIDRSHLEQYGITTVQLINAIQGNNLLVPAGELNNQTGRFSVKVPGLIESYADIFSIPIKSDNQGVVTLGDISTINRTFKEATSITRVNGKRAFVVEVHKRSDANQIDVADKTRAIVDQAKADIPNSISVNYALDQSVFSRQMVSELQGNIATAMLFVMLIVMSALGFRSGLLVGFGIPFSLLIGITVCALLGFSFNFMVMFGLLLALGMLIDGAIVVTEFADRRMMNGRSPREAYTDAVRRMFWPVTASTATTLAAFLPMLFWPGVAGEFMRYLPVTVFAVLVGSLFYALLFLPAVGAVINKTKNTTISDNADDDEGLPILSQLTGPTAAYARVLGAVVERPALISVATIAILYTIFKLYSVYGVGSIFYTESEEIVGSVNIRTQGNYSVEEFLPIINEVENIVLDVEGVRLTYTTINNSNHSFANESPKDTIATILVELYMPEQREQSSKEVFQNIRERTQNIPGILVEADKFNSGPPIGKDINIQISGEDLDKVREVTTEISRYIAQVDELIEHEDSLPLAGIEWEIQVDRAQAALFGLDVLQVGYAVQLSTNGILLGEYRPDDAEDEVEIRIRHPESERSLNTLDQTYINTHAGAVPISQIAKRIPKPKLDSITRIDRAYTMTVKANTEEGIIASNKVEELQAWLDKQRFDPALDIRFRGSNEEQEKSQAFLTTAFSLALFLMFILLVAQFNSFYQAILVLSAVIMSTAGVVLGLMILQRPFSTILTGVGIVSLAGIVVNNNIVLIDTVNYVRREHVHLSPQQAIILSCVQRLRPVFLTTFTTISGLLPMAMHLSIDLINRQVIYGGVVTSNWVALASAIVWGLGFATLLTLIVTPAMLLIPESLKATWQRYRGTRDKPQTI